MFRPDFQQIKYPGKLVTVAFVIGISGFPTILIALNSIFVCILILALPVSIG